MTVDNMHHNSIYAKFFRGGAMYNENAIMVSGEDKLRIEAILKNHGLELGGHGGPADSAKDNYETFKVALDKIKQKYNVSVTYNTNLSGD